MSDVFVVDSVGNEFPVMDGDLLLPYYGNWSASVSFASADLLPSGKVTLSWLGKTFLGHIIRVGENEGRVACMIAGGAGGLAKTVPPKMYDFNVKLQLPVTELLSAVSETLSPSSTQSVLNKQLQNWTRMEKEAAMLLSVLTDQVKTIWRVLPDGSVFVGDDTWSVSDNFDYTLLSQQQMYHTAELAVNSVSLFPGMRFPRADEYEALSQKKMACLRYAISPSSSRLTVWFTEEDGLVYGDPLHAGLSVLIRETMRFVDFHATYSAKVLLQRVNGTLDIVPDGVRLPPMTSVPIRVPVPGMKVIIPDDATDVRCNIVFENGDPTRYAAHLFDAGAGGARISRVGDQVDCGTLTFTAVANGVITGTYTPPGVTPDPKIFNLGDVINLKGKITTGWKRLEVGAPTSGGE